MEYRIPFDHHELTFKLPDDQEVYCLSPRAAEAPGLEFSRDEEMKRVREALESPLGSPPLSRLAREARRAVIITSDHTRPLPSRLTLPLLLEAMRRENPELSLEVLVATGLHEKPDSRVIREKFGDLPDRIPIYWHDARDRENLVSLGTLPSGGPLLVNRRHDEIAQIRDVHHVQEDACFHGFFSAGFVHSPLVGGCKGQTAVF
mgnify:CR=1 FL=1